MVPNLSIVFMAIALAFSFCVPIALCIYYRKAKGADLLPFFTGCAVMLLFAFVFEQLAHSVILGSPAGAVIRGEFWIYALYGGLMAGIFEETGRLIAFKTILRKNRGKNVNALMYGAGHGGFEAMVILGITSLNNIIYSVTINSGNAAALTANLTGDALTQVQTAIDALISTPSYFFLMGAVERVFAIILQISFSVLVWAAANKKGMFKMFPAAILIHCMVDTVTVLLSQAGASVLIIEGVVGIMAAAAGLYAKRVWDKINV